MGQTSRIRDCYEVLESVAWIWRLSGIFPFTLKCPAGAKKYGVNKFYAVYNCLLCLTCIINCAIGLTRFNKNFRDPFSVEPVSILIRTIGSHVVMCLCGLWRIIQHKELIESIDTMATQDYILYKIGCPINYNSSAKQIRAYVWTVTALLVIFTAYYLFTAYDAYGNINITWLFWIIPLITQTMNLTILVSLVALLGVKLRTLNEKIKAIAIRASSSPPKVVVIADACAENLRMVAKAHYNICRIGKRINRSFNREVIIIVMVAFAILSTTLYYIFIEVQREGETSYVRIGMYVHWEVIHGFPIITIVAICNWTTYQAAYAGKLIHEIRVEKIDSQLYEALRSFSLQLHHQKLEFTAAGFFPLNSTLLQMMVGNITTYLVILIQFQPKLSNMI